MPRDAALKASYTVPELARMAGLTRFAMGRLLARLDVRVVPGRPRVVLVSDLRRAAPDLWDSIVEVQSIREVA